MNTIRVSIDIADPMPAVDLAQFAQAANVLRVGDVHFDRDEEQLYFETEDLGALVPARNYEVQYVPGRTPLKTVTAAAKEGS